MLSTDWQNHHVNMTYLFTIAPHADSIHMVKLVFLPAYCTPMIHQARPHIPRYILAQLPHGLATRNVIQQAEINQPGNEQPGNLHRTICHGHFTDHRNLTGLNNVSNDNKGKDTKDDKPKDTKSNGTKGYNLQKIGSFINSNMTLIMTGKQTTVIAKAKALLKAGKLSAQEYNTIASRVTSLKPH